MTLAEKRQAILDDHKRQEKVRGSGWHPADDGALQREQRGESFLSDRPVAFQDDDRVRVVGSCAERIKAAFASFVGKIEANPSLVLISFGEKFQDTAVKCCKRALEQPGDLCLSSQEWNYCAAALMVEGVQVVLTDASSNGA